MKKKLIISICTIVFTIILVGCYHNKKIIQINDTEISGDNFTGYLEPKSENNILRGSTSSGGIISGFFYPIVISGNYINYSGSTSFTIPNIFKYRDYYRNPQIVSTRDGLIFSSDNEKTFIIETTLVTTGETTETVCKRINYGGRLSKKEKKITINGQEIKIAKQTFITSGEGIKPQKSKQTNICFVRNNISYDIRWSDNNINEDTIVNSIFFY